MLEESISNGRAIVCMSTTAMHFYKNIYFVSNTAHVFTVANWYSFFSLVVLKRWRFQFVWLNTLLLIYQQENKFVKMICIMYTSAWKQTAVTLYHSAYRSTCLLCKCFFLSFCEYEKQDLSADRALFSISINRCQHMPQAGLANTSHRITFHQSW